jgi:upstream activation factor subunit UAF30
MARTKTTKTVDAEQASVSATAPVSTPVVEQSATPVVDKKVKAPKAPKAPKTETTAPVVVAPVVATPVEDVSPVAPAADVSEGDALLVDQSVEFLAKLQQLGVLISSLKIEYRTLEKKWTRELKTAQKQSSKRKRKAGSRAPSGFVKPTRISDELAKFLEKPSGSEMARTEVTRDINKYIRTHNLQDTQNGRKINPDSKLAALLKLKKTDELTYFNLQRYMSPHFAKAIKAEVPV